MTKNKFNVLIMDFNNKKVKSYDILPYFRGCWKEKYHKEEKNAIKEASTDKKKKILLKEWIEKRSKYMFWARCEYEFLTAPWPFGSKNITEDLKLFLKEEHDFDEYNDRIKFYNIIMQDMEKIDIHDQIMMNIDVITDILFNEFLKK
jgi:hypothetical protein